MNWEQILPLLGVPTVIGTFIIYVVKRLHESAKRVRALESGVQALLRAQMINDYNKWTERHYAPVYAKDNFENVWKQYHELGANGVMDGIHAEFMGLPTTREEE